jgi:polyhydroxyalkanoate synthesis regulator phasin
MAEELRKPQEEVGRMSVIKNIMLLGVGVASLTREKVEEAVEDLIKRGEVAGADRAKAIDELQQKAQAAATEVRRIVDERIEALGRKLRWTEDLRRLQAEVEKLHERVDKLEGTPKETKPKKA